MSLPTKNGDVGKNALVEDLVYANRILYQHGVVDGFGHISGRLPGQKGFYLSRRLAPGQVEKSDILEFDETGEPSVDGPPVYLERFIHAAIYRKRPDVNSIVHSHSSSVIPFGVTKTVLRPVYHMSGFLGAATPVYDIRDNSGMTDMLVSNNSMGDDLAAVLGNGSVALMRGHGSVAVGGSVPFAVYRAIYTEMNAQLQLKCVALGETKFLDPEEARKADEMMKGQTVRAWDLWKRETNLS